MNNDSLRVLFPKGYRQQARRVFNTSQYMLRNERATIGYKSQKFNIILQPKSSVSNGFVTLGPFRSVFLTTPSQEVFSLGTNNWLNQLGIHETWHALQYMNFKTGLAKTFHTLLGENGQSFIDNYFIPDWYWEGEAVFMETQLTKQGRGRLPSFLDTYKAMWLNNINYNYATIRNGSLKDIVPNRYQSGYITVAYGRNKYGNSFWQPVMQEALLNRKFIKKNNKQHPDHPFHLFKYGFYPLDAALKYQTGKNIKHFYKTSIDYFKQKWEAQQTGANYTKVDTLKPGHSKKVLNYSYPTVTEKGDLLTLKYGYAHLPEIVKIDTAGQEETVVPIGNTLQHYYSYGGQKLVWAEYRPNIRWGWKNYSVIRLYNMKTDKSKTLTHQSKYFSPSLSPNGQKVAAVKISPIQSQIVLLNAQNGKKLKTLPNPHHFFYTYPKFDLSGKYIIVGARDSLSNMALVKINIRTGKQRTLTPFAPKAIGSPSIQRDYIYFPAGFEHNIQIYALNRKNKKIFKVASRPIGDYNVAVDSSADKVLFSEYTATGFQLLSAEIDTTAWMPIKKKTIQKVFNPYIPNALSLNYAKGHAILKDIPQKKIKPKRFYPGKHLFKVRSWSFNSLYPETSLLLTSQDLLNKMQAVAGGGYNFNEKTPFLKVGLNYGGIFPFLRAGIQRIFHRSRLTPDSMSVLWDETNWYAGFQIPLNLSGSLYHRYLSFSGTFHQGIRNFKKPVEWKHEHETINYYILGLSFNMLRNKTLQDINPKLGFAFSLKYYRSLRALPIHQFNADFNILLPGISPNHSLYFTSSFSEKKNNDIYKFENIFHYATGYPSIPYQQIYTLGVHYQLPLCYPDIGLPWAYLSRIRLHLFYETTHAKLPSFLTRQEATLQSLGGTLYFDTKLFKKSIPIGLQYAYLLDKNPITGENFKLSLSFPVNLFFE